MKEFDLLRYKSVFTMLLLFLSLWVFASSPWALVLSGGGARGAYEAGALMAIEKLGLKVEAVYGTSVGALNGAFFVQGITNELYDMWQKLSFNDVVDLPATLSSDSMLSRLFESLSKGGLNVKPLKNLISSYLNEKKIRQSKMDFGLVTFDLSNFQARELYLSNIPNGKLLDYLMASANYPLFKRWRIGKNIYIDGGVYNNAPVSMALKKGFKKILLIDISDIPIFLPSIPDGTELKVIKPSSSLGNPMEFVPQKEKRWEKMGYLDTLKAFGKFDGKIYYIYASNESFIVNAMLKMDFDKIEKLAKFLNVNVDGCSIEFAVYERIIPKLLKIFPSKSFKSLSLNILESAASYIGLERLKAYSQSSLFKEIVGSKVSADWKNVLDASGFFAVKLIKEIHILAN